MGVAVMHTLKHEHRVIEQVMRAMEGVCFRLACEAEMPTAALEEMVDFIRQFVDGYHHAKEEQHLFPSLQRRGISWEGGALGSIEQEHKTERQLIDELQLATQGLQAGSEVSRQVFIEAARKLIAHLTHHMQQEEAILFRLADELFDATDSEAVAAGFRQAESDFGAGRVKQYEKLATALEEKWAL